jgi:transposase
MSPGRFPSKEEAMRRNSGRRQRESSGSIEVLYGHVAGFDVHKETILVCVRQLQPDGSVLKEIRQVGTMTADLLALSDWLRAAGVTHVAMESTGVLWKPVYNLLEGQCTVLLVNAQHLKKVPGRKSDVSDAEWIAQCLQCGLLRASFVPERPQRELRDLTRDRAIVAQERTRVANRVHKVLEDANIKLAAVATDILGVSGRAMLEQLIAGEEDSAQLAELARRRLRAKIPQLRRALHGRVTPHHRFLLRELLDHYDFLTQRMERLSARIAEVLPPPFADAVHRLCTLPGVQERSAQAIVAEIGCDMGRFPSAAHLASWAGVSPGNHESAGQRKSGRPPKGNRWLCRTLTEVAQAAAHTKHTYLRAQFDRLAPRRGKRRAIGALAHTQLTAAYHMLATGTDYHDLGPDYFARLNPERLTRYYVKKLQALGHQVTLTPMAA